MLQSIHMDYSKSILLYQDRPKYGLLLKLILIIPMAFLGASIYSWLSGDSSDSLALLLEALVIGLVFWFVFPREYRVYEDHLRILLGGPFSVKIGLQNISVIRVTSRLSFGVNFVTRITRSHVEIVKKKGWSIAITPTLDDLFVENANRALTEWLKNKT